MRVLADVQAQEYAHPVDACRPGGREPFSRIHVMQTCRPRTAGHCARPGGGRTSDQRLRRHPSGPATPPQAIRSNAVAFEAVGLERRIRHPGRKRHPDRLVFQGILFVLHTGIAGSRRRRGNPSADRGPAAAPAHDARSRGVRHRRRPEGQSSDRGRGSAGGPQGCRRRPPHRRRKSGVPPRISVPTRHPVRSPGGSSAVEPDHPRSPTGSCEVHRKPRRGRVTTWGPCPDGARSAGRRVTGARRKPVPRAVLCDSGEVHVAAPHVGLVEVRGLPDHEQDVVPGVAGCPDGERDVL